MPNANTTSNGITIKGLAPLFQVFDMPTSIRFYRDVLGFAITAKSNHQYSHEDDVDWVLLHLNGTDIMLNTAYEAHERPPAPDPMRIASHEDVSIYFGCPDVDGAYKHFIEKGLVVKPPQTMHYGFYSLNLKDPDGYGLVFHWPADKV